jgi:hypothetical protein
MKSFRRVIEPKKSPLNPKFARGGLDPDQYSRSEWLPSDGSSTITEHFSRNDNDLNYAKKPVMPLMDDERQIYPRPNLEKTAELRQLAAYLASTGFIRT